MKKRLVTLLLVIGMLLSSTTALADEKDRLGGDANGDGQVTAADAAYMLRYIVGLEDDMGLLNMLCADVNANAEIDADDAAAVLRYVTDLAPLRQISTDQTTLRLLKVQSTLSDDATEWAARILHNMPSGKRKTVVYPAARYLGVPYGTGQGQLDCSAYLRTAFENAGVPESVYPHTNSHGTLLWFRRNHPERLHETDPSRWRDWKPGCVLIYVNPVTNRGSHVSLYACEIDGKPIVMESRRMECDGCRIGVLMEDEDKCVLAYYADPFQ